MTGNIKTAQRIYVAVAGLLLASYTWVGLSIAGGSGHFTVCLFRMMTGLPCPSCGTTRSLMALLAGNPGAAVMINPFGILAALALLVLPCWLMADMITGRRSAARCFLMLEEKLKTKQVFIAFVALVLVNWGWNILKEP